MWSSMNYLKRNKYVDGAVKVNCFKYHYSCYFSFNFKSRFQKNDSHMWELSSALISVGSIGFRLSSAVNVNLT